MASGRLDCRVLDPLAEFAAPVVLLAPHSDDETLGCGGTLARLAGHIPVYVVYLTDGRLSPSSRTNQSLPESEGLVEIRRQEARTAMALLGVPEGNLYFLDHPDGGLSDVEAQAESEVRGLLERLQPGTLLAPFRYDQHPDHLATNRIACRIASASPGIALRQYFVYNLYPMMSRPDIREAVRPDHLGRVEIDAVRDLKRRAMACYASQVAVRYPWQRFPVLKPVTVERLCTGDEVFATVDPAITDRALFKPGSPRFWLSLRFGAQAVALKKKYIG